MANSKAYRKYAATTMAAAAAVAVAPIATSAATSFPDVEEGSVHAEAINALANKDIVSGNDNGEFGKYDNVNRAQTAKMIAKALDLKAEDVDKTLSDYDDVDANSSHAEDIAAVTEAGIMEGSGDFDSYRDLPRG